MSSAGGVAPGGRAQALVVRQVDPSAEARFDAWARAAVARLDQQPGHLGSVVLAPPEPGGPHTLVVQFDSPAALAAWESSDARREVVAEADSFSEVTGYGRDHQPFVPRTQLRPPNRTRLALLTWAVLVPLVAGATTLLRPLALPTLVGVAVTAALLVGAMTYVVMPPLTRALAGWLAGDGHEVTLVRREGLRRG